MISPAEALAVRARASLSNYCTTECLAMCCRRGYLLLSAEEVSLLSLNSNDVTVLPIDTRYVFNLRVGCPQLIDFKCCIHKNHNRPKVCKEFPLFIFGNTVIITDDCPAVKENKLYAFLCELKSMGYTIIYSEK